MIILHISFRKVHKLEAKKRFFEDAEGCREQFSGRFTANVDAEEQLATSLQLLSARQLMATEVLFLINELFTEFYCIVAATICGMILRRSSVVTKLSNGMSWSQLPLFLLAQFGPELLAAWGIIVYLRYLGLNWLALGKALFGKPRDVMCKVLATSGLILMFFFFGIGGD